MSFLSLSKVFGPISLLLVLASLVLMVVPGPKLSIEFTGGTLVEVKIPEGKTKNDLAAAVSTFKRTSGDALAAASIATTRDETLMMRLPEISNDEHTALLAHLRTTLGQTLEERQFSSIGPTVGSSLKKRSFAALLVTVVAIIVYIAIAFRKIPRRFNPWMFGVSAVVALLHDVIIVMGIFTILSQYTTFQVDTLFISALLSIMGYSVNDTIVIFDRLRENLIAEGKRESFTVLTERSLRQSISRTLNTGFGALVMLFCLYVLGSESIRWFILALIVGTVIGTYSSFFVATPLLAYVKRKE